MKRSEINAALKEMEQMVQKYRLRFLHFAIYTGKKWERKVMIMRDP